MVKRFDSLQWSPSETGDSRRGTPLHNFVNPARLRRRCGHAYSCRHPAVDDSIAGLEVVTAGTMRDCLPLRAVSIGSRWTDWNLDLEF